MLPKSVPRIIARYWNLSRALLDNPNKIDNEVLILGAMEKIEVWNPKIYDEYIKQAGQTYEQIAAKVMK